jgi:uncharacterized integral membrane protein
MPNVAITCAPVVHLLNPAREGVDTTMNSRPPVSARRTSESGSAAGTSRTRSSPFTKLSAAWWALVVGLLILAVLLIFVAQNTDPVPVHFLGFHWSLPVGVGYLLSGVAGASVTVLVGAARMLQLRRAARRTIRPV